MWRLKIKSESVFNNDKKFLWIDSFASHKGKFLNKKPEKNNAETKFIVLKTT